MTDEEAYAEADRAAKNWLPAWFRNGDKLIPNAPTITELSGRRTELTLETPTRRGERIVDVPQDMFMGADGGGTEPPCECSSGAGGGS